MYDRSGLLHTSAYIENALNIPTLNIPASAEQASGAAAAQ